MIRIISLTERGKKLSDKMSSLIEGAVVCHKPQPFISEVQGFFNAGDRLIFICATGIVMRTLEPVITTANSYLQPKYTVGMGCERNCPEEELERLLMDCLTQQGLSIEQVSSLSSIDIKADEVGLISLAAKLDLPYLTWDKAQLSTVEDQLSTRSEYVFKTVGVYGVAESAALYSAQSLLVVQKDTAQGQAELILNKQKTAKATCAIARVYVG